MNDYTLLLATVVASIIVGVFYAWFLSASFTPKVYHRLAHPSRWWVLLITALAGVGLAAFVTAPPTGVLVGVLAAAAVVPAVVDAVTRRLPNRMMLHISAVALALAVGVSWLTGAWLRLGAALTIAAGLLVVLGVVSIASGGRLGMGDAKYAPALALLVLLSVPALPGEVMPTAGVLWLVWLSVALVWLAGAFMLASLYSVCSMVFRRVKSVPFGPFLAASALLTMPTVQFLPSLLAPALAGA